MKDLPRIVITDFICDPRYEYKKFDGKWQWHFSKNAQKNESIKRARERYQPETGT